MNATNLTLLVVAVIGVISSYVTPKLLNRQAERKAEDDATDVSWVAINRALVKERDDAKDALAVQVKTSAAEVEALRQSHRDEIKSITDRLTESQDTVAKLYRDIYKLQRQPPSQ